MKVNELIKILKKCDGKATVLVQPEDILFPFSEECKEIKDIVFYLDKKCPKICLKTFTEEDVFDNTLKSIGG